MTKGLTPREQSLYDCLKARGYNQDVPIKALFDAVYDPDKVSVNVEDTRIVQQYIGSVVSRINRRLGGKFIVPGETKRTYKLLTLASPT